MGGVHDAELFIVGLLCAVSSVAILWTFVVCRRGELPRNLFVGVRMWQVMKSERTWVEIHMRYAPVFLIVGFLSAACAVVGVLGSVSLVGEDAAWGAMATMGVTAISIAFVGAVFAEVHAYKLNRDSRKSRLGGGSA